MLDASLAEADGCQREEVGGQGRAFFLHSVIGRRNSGDNGAVYS